MWTFRLKKNGGHANVLMCYGIFNVGAMGYGIVTEWCAGGSLKAWLKLHSQQVFFLPKAVSLNHRISLNNTEITT